MPLFPGSNGIVLDVITFDCGQDENGQPSMFALPYHYSFSGKTAVVPKDHSVRVSESNRIVQVHRQLVSC